MDGLLKLYETILVPRFAYDGKPIINSNNEAETKRDEYVSASFALRSGQMLIHRGQLSEALLHQADRALALIDYDNDDAIIEALFTAGVEGRAKAWNDLRHAWDSITEACNLCRETQEFLEAGNLKNLVTWTNDWRAPIHIKCGFDQAGRVWFKNSRFRYDLIPNSSDITAPLPEIPRKGSR
ncbi:hypothetical protein RZS28_05640 [Methylocapsa polymorpha]|uniref:Uncharacterized protein n=1 Tax=Methylocapsa polymorpha TaxID=3080828 RepID=A0ABZ0HVD3_9HYPH|nr:hypothetical protein RZS28_05640 [Methylocapsa sp. RX1]